MMTALLWFVARRLALSAGTLLLVLVLVFLATEVLPGDALTASLPADELVYMTEESLDAMRHELGLDGPAWERLGRLVIDCFTFDFGRTYVEQEPVWPQIADPLANSLLFAAVAALIAPTAAIVLGILSALRPGGRLDATIGTVTLTGYSLPDFVVGNLAIIVFALWLGIAPAVIRLPTDASAAELLPVAILPALALAVSGAAYQYRLLRAGMIEALASDFVERARLGGIPEHRLVLVHALPVALVPMLNATAIYVAYLISGAVVIEAVFNYPGVGLELIRAISQRELPIVQAIAFLAAGAVVAGNLLADLAILALDPRVRRASHAR